VLSRQDHRSRHWRRCLGYSKDFVDEGRNVLFPFPP
jgi:hypothetical protein